MKNNLVSMSNNCWNERLVPVRLHMFIMTSSLLTYPLRGFELASCRVRASGDELGLCCNWRSVLTNSIGGLWARTRWMWSRPGFGSAATTCWTLCRASFRQNYTCMAWLVISSFRAQLFIPNCLAWNIVIFMWNTGTYIWHTGNTTLGVMTKAWSYSQYIIN